MRLLTNEVFALRDSENLSLFADKPSTGRVIAVQARTVEFPPGPFQPLRTTDGAPVERAAIIAADWVPSKESWQWVHLSPSTKETIGDLLFDCSADKDRWYYLLIEPVMSEAIATEVPV